MQLARTNHMPKILDIWLAKFTFLEFSLKFMLAKSVKNLLQMSFVLFCIIALNENIIQID